MTTDFWIQKIREWGVDRKITGPEGSGSVSGQMRKLSEEHVELMDGIQAGDREATLDAIGDMGVVLVMLCDMLDTSLLECLNLAYLEIRDRKGEMRDGVFVKES